MTVEVLSVKGMSCGHCVKAVETSVGKLDGIETVSVNLEDAKVEVAFDESKVHLEVIKETIEEQGYDVL
ncbi:copper chaperone CopZ [Mangrovibacillus cuniculi]|uniref:Copper chaperone CopZ n=1 Tax=Mangrovibacillus cuniculi TaxID=2593652 RepID=A0A7S8HFZ4_9BACI|nr:copper chaperone CopZ [Mangrovibacillus cuniculi]QPC47434.1 copper chaperone CopZ [Mangrovibacillus cuniculi]